MAAVLIARYYVNPGNSAAVKEALKKMAVRVKADEPACLVYNANIDPENENLY
jgi:quinol monooxygenase YgiN